MNLLFGCSQVDDDASAKDIKKAYRCEIEFAFLLELHEARMLEHDICVQVQQICI